MTTLRDIITEDLNALWRDNNGDIWDGSNILEQWGADLDKPASCLDGQVRYYDAQDYLTGAEAVLTEIDVDQMVNTMLGHLAEVTGDDGEPTDYEIEHLHEMIMRSLRSMISR